MELELLPIVGGRDAYDDTPDPDLERLFVAWAGRRSARYEEKRLEREWWARLFGAEVSAAPVKPKPKK